jgi:amidohydrolase
MKFNIMEKSKNIYDFMVEIRRKIHEHPELGFQENNTGKLIMEHLEKLNIPYKSDIGKTGIAGIIEGKRGKGKCIGLRADMDALPLSDEKEVTYKSKIPNVMHACGHDGHVAMLLGTAKILKEMEEEFSGTVKLIFQPAEECIGGALPMIQEGVMENPHVDIMTALHLYSSDKTGTVIFKSGVGSAAQDDFEIIIYGKGGHAAYPDKSIDSVLLASRLIVELHHIISRKIDPHQTAVLTVGMVHSGSKSNIIADKAMMKGTIRYLDDKTGEELRYWIEKITKGVVETENAHSEVKFERGYPTTINNEELTEKIWNYIEGLSDDLLLKKEGKSTMGAEDFSYFSRQVPSVMLGLGSNGDREEFSFPHHHPKFDFDEKAMIYGTAIFSHIVLNYLSE